MYRAKTNESTRAPEDVYAEATEFISLYPTRRDVSNWAAVVTRELNGLPMMRNAWRKTAYDWFLGEPRGGDVAVTADEEEEHDDFDELLDDEEDDYEEGDTDKHGDDDDAVDDYDVLIN